METKIKMNNLWFMSRAKTNRNIDSRIGPEKVVVKRNINALRVPSIQNDISGLWAEELTGGEKALFITFLCRRNIGRFGRLDKGGEPRVIAGSKGQQSSVGKLPDNQLGIAARSSPPTFLFRTGERQ